MSGLSPRRDWENVVWLGLSALPDSSLQHTRHFDRLYSENHRWLQGWLWRRLGCHANAEDLTQDTFLRTLKPTQLASIEEPRAFLCLIASRVLCSFWRHTELHRACLDALASPPAASKSRFPSS
ncbi:sigma factor [Pseudomonas piscis]|nr:sigma factor [Pseudomonas sp. FW507-12TSA]POA56809.1 hypothetical protein C1889_09520 [Pseudomonas sp. FW507-12TSA]